MYFTFGVLTMVAMISIGAIVYGIVKVFKMEKQIKGIQENANHGYNDINDRFRDVRNDVHQQFRDIHQDVDQQFKDVHQQIENCHANAVDMANAYTDMRVDKLEDKLTNKPKQLIKG